MLDRLFCFWALCGGALLLAIVLATAVNTGALVADTITRGFGVRIPTLSGYEDFVRLVIAPALLAFFPYCQWQRGHIQITWASNLFSHRQQHRLNQFWHVIGSISAAALAVMLTQGMLELRRDNALSPVLEWREWLFFIPAVASVCLWWLAATAQLLTPQKI